MSWGLEDVGFLTLSQTVPNPSGRCLAESCSFYRPLGVYHGGIMRVKVKPSSSRKIVLGSYCSVIQASSRRSKKLLLLLTTLTM